MALELFIKGLIIGFSVSMPVGPIGLLCIRNVLTFGIVCGLITGLGAAFADTVYGALAGFGITAIGTFLESHHMYIQTIGALFLCYLGIATFCAKSSSSSNCNTDIKHSRVFLTTFFLTLTNPMTIISFAGVYAGLGMGLGSPGIAGGLTITLGVFLGSAVWWLMLSFATSLFKNKMSPKLFAWLNKFSGSVIFGFGAYTLIA